jgi:rhodanese-related sulfurtransferase
VTARPPVTRTAEEILGAARGRLRRLTPRQAFTEAGQGAWLVDIRPAAQRASEGEVPGALIVERNALEWRFDPAGSARLPQVDGYDHRIIVICSEGYASSLAAASLQDLGHGRATDVDRGFQAWAACGLLATGQAGASAVAHDAADQKTSSSLA